MELEKKRHFHTRVIHAAMNPSEWQGATLPPIYQTAAHRHLANIGDCKSLIIHPYSSQYLAFAGEMSKRLSITPDLVRLSVGIEAVEDIIDDLAQALEKSRP